MRIVLADARPPLGDRIAGLLQASHTVVPVEDMSAPALDAAMTGADAVFHVPPLLGSGPAPDLAAERQELDDARRFYLLLQAAVARNVRRVVHVSSLAVMRGHFGQGYILTERWCPRPGANAHDLALHAEEMALREFVHQHRFAGVCLRIDEDWLRGQPPRTEAVAGACARGLVMDAPWGRLFGVFHVRID